MALILHLETATTVCSVALAREGQLLALRELNSGYTHAENLHSFVQEVLSEAGAEIKDLAAIAVSKGPGSYTGLRIGVSTAKGLAYALGIPLISLDTLQIMSSRAVQLKKETAFYCPMIDARRMEVYTAIYNSALEPIRTVEALIVEENSLAAFRAYTPVYFFGDGMPKCHDLLSALPGAGFIDHIVPSAGDMCALAYHKFNTGHFENVAYFEPFYLKDFLITKKTP